MDISGALSPWLQHARQLVPGLELFDAHTHLGQNDPDGYKQTPQELLDVLRTADAVGCFVFPMHEPDGYPAANDFVTDLTLEHNASHPNGPQLVSFCRVDPAVGPIAEAQRSLARGARGIKLHPRAEQFQLDHPAVTDLFALAHERVLPILIHAGRGIPALGTHVVAQAEKFPGARVILAHAAVSDLAWIWRVAADLPNLMFDSSWWIPADLLALYTLVPPAQILFAADVPYGHTDVNAAAQVRLALQAGLTPAQVRLVMSEQSLNVAHGRALAVAGPAVGERDGAGHVLLDRVAELLQIGTLLEFRGFDGEEILALARLATQVPDEIDDAPVFAAISKLIDSYDQACAENPDDRGRLGLLILASAVARTPDVALPTL